MPALKIIENFTRRFFNILDLKLEFLNISKQGLVKIIYEFTTQLSDLIGEKTCKRGTASPHSIRCFIQGCIYSVLFQFIAACQTCKTCPHNPDTCRRAWWSCKSTVYRQSR